MPDLIAQGEEPQQRWRRALPEGETLTLGRAAGVWAAPWDSHISRSHARFSLHGTRLEVAALPEARNPIYFQGKEAKRFVVGPGEHFVIGHTTFTLVDQRVAVTVDAPQPLRQQAYSAKYLKQIAFRNPDHRIEVLGRLPQLISGATGDGELCVRLVSMVLAGIPRAQTAAIVAVEDPLDESTDERPPVEVLHWDQRLLVAGDFRPSQRLIVETVRQGQSILHVWTGSPTVGSPEATESFTASGDLDWAFCVPVVEKTTEKAVSTGCWAIYVAGRFNIELPSGSGASDPNDVLEDMKFTELVAATLSSLRQMRRLERQHANLGQFFSPVVVETLAGGDPDLVLAPRETKVSVLFCDLRGFARQTEQHAEKLMALLERVSQALGVMTHQILDQGGVVGDFQGDAAMGFWGWPLAREDDVLRICRAALAIRRRFESAARDAASPLAGFHVGIGLATGIAVAGKIGTVDQVKVTVFGPVVNLASRLEGMTKIVRASILIDEPTAAAVRRDVPPDVARVRRVAVVRPYGLEASLEISELLPPEADSPQLNDEHVMAYEAALDAFLAGRWTESLRLLHRVPTDDVVTDFLTATIAKHNRVPPPGFDGVIPLETK
ncbi:MAG: adenylate/guanylate cyclase domain-containing protein [Pirellulaceae bacterium]|nr:adenylate/guanylate cyclase domain-containing protein [Pirellulaceae bacterium]